ncbi:PD-(D/E)XK nuclease family protein [Nautilia sp.]
MIFKVFSTKREIREFIKSKEDVFLPKLITIGEFLDRCMVVKNASLISGDLKKIYLYRALENIDVQKLGIKKDFLDFFKNSEFIFSFFNEIYLEKRKIEEIETADTYLEYEEHLLILKNLYYSYKELLHENGLYDRITVEEYEINEGFFEGVKKVEINLSGYLPKFDLEILSKIPVEVEIVFTLTPYNKRLIKKMFGISKEGEYRFDFHNKKVLDFKPLKTGTDVKIEYFSDRMEEVAFVFASIEEMVSSGISPDKIAVVLPDERFNEYLQLFDIHNNLNFAMGESFVYSDIYIMLEAVYKYINEKDETALKKAYDEIKEFEKINSFEEVLEFVLKHANVKERKILDEEIYKLSKIRELASFSKEKTLHFILERFKNLTFDDVGGGKVTVMGVLESRGMKFDGVIIVDFNDDYVPNVGDKDFFLNSSIRKRTSLPTRADKEDLQKNYYYNILINSKKAKIAYVKNEEKEASRFLYELGLESGKNRDEYYRHILFNDKKPGFYEYEHIFELPKILTPTKMKILLECPMKYYFSYVLNVKNDEKKEYFGTKLHNVLKDVLKEPVSSEKEYFEKIMESLLKNADKKETFEIKALWEDKIKKFAYKDFKELDGPVLTEHPLEEKKYKNFILQARADRIVGKKIYDYKTASNRDYLKDMTQAEFYKFLMPEAEIYFWDLNKAELIKVEPDMENFKNKINSLVNFTKRSEDKKICKYCDYRFACLHFES